MTTVNALGFSRTRLDERIAELTAALQAIFGPSLNLDPDTIDGQTVGIYSEFIANLDQLAEDVYHSFNPNSATGAALSRLVQLNGIRRIQGAFSTATITATGTEGTLIPAGSLVKTTVGNTQFATDVDATIGSSGLVNINVTALSMGALVAPAATITKIDTPIYGWQSVTNATDAIPGRSEETDEQLRIRRRKSTSTPAQAVLDSIYGTLSNIPDVRQVRVYENDSDTVDGNGLTGHSIKAVVDGGTDAAIGAALWSKKTVGTTTLGSTSVAVLDSQGASHTMRFARPTSVNVYITINIVQKAGWDVTGGVQKIKDALVAFGLAEQEIGEELIQSRLYTPVNSIAGHSITSLFIGTSPSPAGTANIAVAYDAIARIDSSRIVVNVT